MALEGICKHFPEQLVMLWAQSPKTPAGATPAPGQGREGATAPGACPSTSCVPGALSSAQTPQLLPHSFPSRLCAWVRLSRVTHTVLGVALLPRSCFSWLCLDQCQHYPLYRVQQLCHVSPHLWDRCELPGDADAAAEGSGELLPSAVLGMRESPGSPSAAVPGTVCEIPDCESSSRGSAGAVPPA